MARTTDADVEDTPPPPAMEDARVDAEEEPMDVFDEDAGCMIERVTAAPLLTPTGGGGSGWSNADAIKKEDDVGATESGCCGGDSEVINAAAFGFAIPPTAEIRGVKVIVRVRANIATLAQDKTMKLTPLSDAGADLKMGPTYPTTFETRTYGDDANLWGLKLTPAIVNGADFGVAIRTTHNTIVGSSTSIDAVRMTVIYCRY